MDRIHRRACCAVAFALSCILGGCGSSLDLAVVSAVPSPVVTYLPLDIGVYYDEDFRERVYTENSEDRENWQIDTREARLALFRRILPSMFETVVELSGPQAPADARVDAILVPRPVELQVALPEETHSGLYEAWLKYRIRLHDSGGALLAEWELAGYGKQSEDGAFSSREENLNAVIDTAFRDLGAKLVLGFARQPDVRSWLCSRPGPSPVDCPGEKIELRQRPVPC